MEPWLQNLRLHIHCKSPTFLTDDPFSLRAIYLFPPMRLDACSFRQTMISLSFGYSLILMTPRGCRQRWESAMIEFHPVSPTLPNQLFRPAMSPHPAILSWRHPQILRGAKG